MYWIFRIAQVKEKVSFCKLFSHVYGITLVLNRALLTLFHENILKWRRNTCVGLGHRFADFVEVIGA